MSHSALVVAALVAAIVVLVQQGGGLYPLIAVVVSGLEALLAFGLVHLSIAHLPLGLILGGVLAVVGVVLYVRVAAKSAVAASTIITLVGVIQVMRGLRVW